MEFTTMNNFSETNRKHAIECPVCKKMFKAAPEHAYHIGADRKKLVCSYNCEQKWYREQEEKKKRKAAAKKQAPAAKRASVTNNIIKEVSGKVAEAEKKATNFDRLKKIDVKEAAKEIAAFAHEANSVFYTPRSALIELALKWLESEAKT